MQVLATDWDSATQVLASVGATVATGVALTAASATFRRSTDEVEARYRKDLAASYTYDLVLRQEDGETVEAEIVDEAPKTPKDSRPEDEARRRMATLPIDYHAQVLAQSRQSFLFSIGAAVVGFVVVVASVLLVLGGLVTPGIVGMVGATLTEAVAALFFQISNKARVTMTGQLEGFRAAEELERKSRERKELIEMVKDPATRDDLLTQTVLKLTEVDRRSALSGGRPADQLD